MWLGFGFQLEFLGRSAFVPGLMGASVVFFAVNCWILGVVVSDAFGVGGGEVGTGKRSEQVDVNMNASAKGSTQKTKKVQ